VRRWTDNKSKRLSASLPLPISLYSDPDMSDNSINILKQELIEALQSPKLNFDRIIDLASKLGQTDPEFVRFTVDAGHISRLGRELVGRQETAVSELIKNAYDADATEVVLTFQDTEGPGGTLIIDDNGSGMTHSQLVQGFMRLSSREKVREPVSPRYQRTRAGKKGIGRFAAQRLGTSLTIVTQSTEESSALQVTLDWDKFLGELDLAAISARIERIPKEKPEGTTLVIHGLREAWSEAAIRRIYRYVSELLQPFPLSKSTKHTSIDPGFETILFLERDAELYQIASVESMIYDFALAEVDATVDEKGTALWSVRSDLIGFEYLNEAIGKTRDKPRSSFEFLRNVHVKAYYYIYDSSLIPRNQMSFIRDIASERAGIRLYRNGFRVLPYGEAFNDWLNLDRRYAQRVEMVPIANRQWFGFVEITDLAGTTFEETSSREGLIENEAFAELTDFVSRVLIAAALRVGAERARTPRSTQNEPPPPDPIERGNATADRLDSLAATIAGDSTGVDGQKPAPATPPNSEDVASALRAAAEEIRAATAAQEAKQIELLNEMNMLRILSSLGLTIGEFVHEIGHLVPSLEGGVKALRQYHVREQNTQMSRTAQNLEQTVQLLASYSSYFHGTISSIASRDMVPQELGRVVRAFHRTVRKGMSRYGIVFDEPDIQGYDLFTCPMHESEWSSILYNLLSNSRKAITRERSKGHISITVGRRGRFVFLEFSDNGDGIKEEFRDRIFDAFFTTTTPAGPMANRDDEAIGSGLGLKIVRDIVHGYTGDITLVDAPPGFKTCFRVEVPAATEQELEQHVH
jgi:signal transduction histidine kinase